jgi:hypothetical protein
MAQEEADQQPAETDTDERVFDDRETDTTEAARHDRPWKSDAPARRSRCSSSAA